jgi:hypothetical protein
MHPCEQKDNIEHIKEDLSNHKAWRIATSTQLADISIQLATLNERLKQKLEGFDKHIEEGVSFRSNITNTAIGLVISLGLTICGAVYAYGGLSKQVEINTEKWAVLESK